MSGWGIADTASPINKIKAESADFLNGLNSCAVIDWDTYSYAFDFYESLIDEAYRQGKADGQTEPHWIPCSERLPDRFGQVLCTFIPSGGTLWTSVIIAHYSDLMGISKPCFWIGDVGKNSFQNITKQVTAWMPLPEPWKGEQP